MNLISQDNIKYLEMLLYVLVIGSQIWLLSYLHKKSNGNIEKGMVILSIVMIALSGILIYTRKNLNNSAEHFTTFTWSPNPDSKGLRYATSSDGSSLKRVSSNDCGGCPTGQGCWRLYNKNNKARKDVFCFPLNPTGEVSVPV